MASDPPFYGIFVPSKALLFENSDDVIACNCVLVPPSQNPGYAYAWIDWESNAWLPFQL